MGKGHKTRQTMKQTTDNTHSFRPRGSMRVPLRPMPTMEQIEQEMRLTEAGFYVVAAAANELASVAVFDAMDTLRRNGFHGNKEARKWATKCEKDIHSYETMMRIRTHPGAWARWPKTAGTNTRYGSTPPTVRTKR